MTYKVPPSGRVLRSPRGPKVLGEDPYQHLSLSGRVAEIWDDPGLTVMDRLSMRYTGEPWQERKPCVSALVQIDRWHSYGLLSESSDYSLTQKST